MRVRPTIPSIIYSLGDKRGLLGDPRDWVICDGHRTFRDQLHRSRSKKHVASPAADPCRADEADDSLSMLLQLLLRLLDELAMARQVARPHASNVQAIVDLLDAQGLGARGQSELAGRAPRFCATIDGLAFQAALGLDCELAEPYGLLANAPGAGDAS